MVEHYKKLVKLVARAFYDDITSTRNNRTKTGRSDNRGIIVVVLDALTRRQWVREEDLARDLKLQTKQLGRVLKFLEEEKYIMRYQRREKETTKERKETLKLRTHSYCCLDYAQICDVVRFRLQCMKKLITDELKNKKTVQEYLCPNCGKRYNALDALHLISFKDEYFHCESCDGRLEVEADEKFAVQKGGDGDDDNAGRRREMLKVMLQNMEVQLKPLMEQLKRVEDLPVPEFGSLQEWEARARAALHAANGDSRTSQGLRYGGTPMPYCGDTKVVVDFKGEDIKSVPESTSVKVLESTSAKVFPPWMIKQGMTLTKEQRGEVKQETKTDEGSTFTTAKQFSDDDKKSTVENDDKKSLQDEYIKAYYAALFKRQQEMEEAAKAQEQLSNKLISEDRFGNNSHRQVGMKSKRDEDEDEADKTEWVEIPISGNAGENYKVHGLNVEANAQESDDEVEWEED